MTKKKIIAICDHPESTSGVATQARFLMQGLVKTGRYSFKVLGAALRHQNYDLRRMHPDILIKPIDGFGDDNTLRQLLVTEKPDGLFLFTDPRFFHHVWRLEDEIHQICPIFYNTIWDNGKMAPAYNKYVYQSCDLIHCINHPTYEFVKEWVPQIAHYTPHAVPKDIYKPLPADTVSLFKRKLLGADRNDHFVVLYVGRNARRKRTADILRSFKLFLDKVDKTKTTLVMHADPLDREGPNLNTLVDKLGIKENVVFSNTQVAFNDMALLYNMSDVLVNISCAEGFGLPVLEMKMCGKPALAIKTGGLERQVVDYTTGEPVGVPLDVDVDILVGNQVAPYIYDDYCSVKSVADGLFDFYNLSPEAREEMGKKCMEHAHRDYDLPTVVDTWDRTLMDTMENWRARRGETWRQFEL